MFACTSLPCPGKKISFAAYALLVGAVGVSAKTRPCAQNDYVCTEMLCEIYDGATTDSGTYLYGTNQWGYDGSGAQCITVELDDDKTDAASFNATWSWLNNSDYVHSYPNVQYESIQLPTKISNIDSFQLNASWSVWPSSSYSATTDIDALDAIDCKADIALDMFFDPDSTIATNASAAMYEFMVWGAVWGGVWPIGYYTPTTGAPNYTLGDITFQLFVGQNQQGQKQTVYSWVPTENVDSIKGDLMQLLDVVVQAGNLSSDLYLGVVQFGTETVHATENVTSEFKSIYMDLGVKSARATSKTSSAGSATATSSGFGYAMMPTITSFAYPMAMGAAAFLAL